MWRSWVLILIGQVFIKIFQLTSEVRRGLFSLSHIPLCTTSTRNLVKNYSILCFFGRAVDTRTVYCTNFPSPYRYCMLFLLFHQNKFQIKTRLLTNYTSILFKLTGNLNCRINRNNINEPQNTTTNNNDRLMQETRPKHPLCSKDTDQLLICP